MKKEIIVGDLVLKLHQNYSHSHRSRFEFVQHFEEGRKIATSPTQRYIDWDDLIDWLERLLSSIYKKDNSENSVLKRQEQEKLFKTFPEAERYLNKISGGDLDKPELIAPIIWLLIGIIIGMS